MDPVENAATRFAALSAVFDGATQRHLLDRRLTAGWRCLEVGGGGGSIATWLSERVGATGRVLVTDVDTRFLEALRSPHLDVLRHDITRDPLPEGAYDLIHTRMVLIHLPERTEVLRRLTTALRPGGWLVCEEFDSGSIPPDPTISPGEVVLKTHQAMAQLNETRGVNRLCGRLLFEQFRSLGLAELGAEGHLHMVQSDSQIAALLRASYERRRSAMIGAGYLTDDEFDRDLARTAMVDFLMPSPIMWTVWGRRR